MKFLMFFAFCSLLISSCKQETAPKDVAADFVRKLYLLDFEGAAALSGAEAKDLIQKARQDLEQRTRIDEEQGLRNAAPADSLFELAQFTESEQGSERIVQNSVLRVALRPEGDGWKVVPTAELVDAVVNQRFYLEEVKTAWTRLQSEYEKRMNITREYISMKKNTGDQSAALADLDNALKACQAGKTGTATERADYVSKQTLLENLLEKSVQPALNASTDMSMNYILQLSDSRTRIRQEREAYNTVAGKARVRDWLPLVGS